MHIYITGGTGFVGSSVIKQLLDRGHTVRCLTRPGSQPATIQAAGVEFHPADLLKPAALAQGIAGCDAVIHLVGIIRPFPKRGITFERLHVEATASVLAATQQANVQRYLHMSANGAAAGATTAYQQSKWQAEQLVKQSTLDWTIFRPSLIYGKHGEFSRMLCQQLHFLPLIPVIGNGDYPLMPVWVEDVAQGFCNALSQPQSIGKIYHCCGPQQCTYNELLDLFAGALDKKNPTKVHMPLPLMQGLTGLLESLPFYPVTRDQITMLVQGNIGDGQPWWQDLGISPLPLAAGIKKALNA